MLNEIAFQNKPLEFYVREENNLFNEEITVEFMQVINIMCGSIHLKIYISIINLKGKLKHHIEE